MKITVFGAGYVGLVTSTCLSQMGNHVICIDNDKEKIKKLNQSKIPIFEPGLSELVSSNLNKRLSFTSEVQPSLIDCDLVFLQRGEKLSPKLFNEIQIPIIFWSTEPI